MLTLKVTLAENVIIGPLDAWWLSLLRGNKVFPTLTFSLSSLPSDIWSFFNIKKYIQDFLSHSATLATYQKLVPYKNPALLHPFHAFACFKDRILFPFTFNWVVFTLTFFLLSLWPPGTQVSDNQTYSEEECFLAIWFFITRNPLHVWFYTSLVCTNFGIKKFGFLFVYLVLVVILIACLFDG